jgi:hypothetical protein
LATARGERVVRSAVVHTITIIGWRAVEDLGAKIGRASS